MISLAEALTRTSPTWPHRHGIIEQALRRRLAELDPAADPIGTETLLAPLQAGLDRTQTGELITRVVALGKNLPGLVAAKGTRQKFGKEFPTYLWAHVPYSEPADTLHIAHRRSADTASTIRGEPRQAQSSGAANPGTSLADRVLKLEDWAARTDPLFRVL